MSTTETVVGTVDTTGKWASIHITNEAGGTDTLPKGRYRVEVTSKFYDYEIGTRMIGKLLDAADVELARKVGTCSGERREFSPEVVYFASNDFTREAS